MSKSGNVVKSTLEFEKFCTRAPHPQNAIDLFQSRWTSDISDVVPGVRAGETRFFTVDRRPGFLLKHFANSNGTLEGMRILELGPLEGAHTYQLESLGADEIVAVEANAEAFLKCLIVKEITELKRARFLFGDVVEFLREEPHDFDIVFCSGILYHMEHPLELIELMSRCADRVFVWTHYWNPEIDRKLWRGRKEVEVERWGETFTYYRLDYGSTSDFGTFWGGNKPSASWLSREDILRAFRLCGLTKSDVHMERQSPADSPSFSVSVWRETSK